MDTEVTVLYLFGSLNNSLERLHEISVENSSNYTYYQYDRTYGTNTYDKVNMPAEGYPE